MAQLYKCNPTKKTHVAKISTKDIVGMMKREYFFNVAKVLTITVSVLGG
jgi:hypothetical protein